MGGRGGPQVGSGATSRPSRPYHGAMRPPNCQIVLVRCRRGRVRAGCGPACRVQCGSRAGGPGAGAEIVLAYRRISIKSSSFSGRKLYKKKIIHFFGTSSFD